jgi:hypothetical protein
MSYFSCRAARAALTHGFLFLCTGVSQGVLLVYEGFNGYSGSMSTVTPNAFTVGLNTSVAYGGATVANYTVSSGLTFGSNFATSGGSISVTGATAVAAATLAIGGTPYTGTLYNSYLVQITNRSTAAAGDGSAARVASATDQTGERFVAYADSRNSSTQVAVGYDGGAANSTAAGNSLVTSPTTTYLIIARFTGVGSTGTSQTASIFAMTQAQYENFLGLGGTEAVLDGLSVVAGGLTGLTAKGTDTGSVTEGFATGNFVHFVSVANTAKFDELRYGSTLADVIPVPEPGAGALGILGAALLMRRRRASARSGDAG